MHCPNYFVWHTTLKADPCYFDFGQYKQALQMLAVIGRITAPGDENYVPKDSLLKAIVKAAESQGFSVQPSHFSDKANP